MALPSVTSAQYTIGGREARIVVTISSAEYHTFTLERQVYGSTTWQTVLGASNAIVPPYGRVLVRDWAFPSSIPSVIYRARGISMDYDEDVGEVTAECIGGEDYGSDYIVSAVDPQRSVAVHVSALEEREFTSDSDVLFVPGRSDPVVTSTQIYSPSSELVVITETEEQRRGMEYVLRTSPYIIFMPRFPLEFGVDTGVRFYAVSKGAETRTSRRGRETSRFWELDVQEISAPAYLADTFNYRIWEDYLPYTWSDVLGGAYTSPPVSPSLWLDVIQTW